MSKKKLPDNQIAVYQTPDGSVNIEVMYAQENIWLSQKRMAELFGCSSDNISLHLRNIYQEKELEPAATTEDFSVVQKEGNREISRVVTCCEKFSKQQDTEYSSDFDKFLKHLPKGKGKS